MIGSVRILNVLCVWQYFQDRVVTLRGCLCSGYVQKCVVFFSLELGLSRRSKCQKHYVLGLDWPSDCTFYSDEQIWLVFPKRFIEIWLKQPLMCRYSRTWMNRVTYQQIYFDGQINDKCLLKCLNGVTAIYEWFISK